MWLLSVKIYTQHSNLYSFDTKIDKVTKSQFIVPSNVLIIYREVIFLNIT